MFNFYPRSYKRKNSKFVDLKISGDEIIKFLISKGVKTCDKVKNQVSVPDWINKDINWIKEHKEEWKLKNK